MYILLGSQLWGGNNYYTNCHVHLFINYFYQLFAHVPESKFSKCNIDTTRSSYLSYTPTSPSPSPNKHYSRGGEGVSPLPPSLSSPGGAPTPSPSPDRHGGGLQSSGGGGSHSIRSPEDISSPNQRFEFLSTLKNLSNVQS